MHIVNDLKSCLAIIKMTISRLTDDKQLVRLLENYKKDNDLLKIEEIMTKDVNYKIAGRFNKIINLNRDEKS